MYSLYRAWFGDENYPHLETLSPPDTVVRVGCDGEHQFVAHRGVLAAHSGYLKSLLSNGEGMADLSTVITDSQRITTISVSSVGGEAFAPLLNYMYTGHLDVTIDNIYTLLLASHLLHMPGALEQCRVALGRFYNAPPPPVPLPPPPLSSSPSHSGTTLYRPVPNRLVGPPLCWPQSNLYSSAPVAFPHLTNLQLPSGIPPLHNSRIVHETTVTTADSFRMNTSTTSSTCHITGKSQKNSGKIGAKGMKAKAKENKDELSLRINDREMEEIKNEQGQRSTISRDISISPGNNDKICALNTESLLHQRSSSRSSRASNENNSTVNSNGVVLDIACCDGPVTFHRVLNENYTSPPTTQSDVQSRSKVAQICASSSRDEEIIGENDENGQPEREENDDSSGNSNGSGGNYTCEYCRHTFKSHYCYKKHAKRHLLPSSVDETIIIGRNEERKREVRLLDLNVQYYPCKICGSKFPSYYFVHKHKKLCHASADEQNTEVENNQIVEAIASSSKS